MKKKVVLVLNYAPHYRKRIYQLLESTFDADFYFGNKTFAKIKKLDYSNLKKPVKEIKFVRIGHYFNWLWGSVYLSFKNYDNYILTGEPYCISSWLIIIINRLLRKKTYLWTHGLYTSKKGLRNSIKYYYFNLASGLFLYNHRGKNILSKMGVAENKMWVINNSLDYDLQVKHRLKALPENDFYFNHFNNTLPVILFIGRLEKQKKIDQLFQAQDLALKNNNPFNLILVGAGSQKTQLETRYKDVSNVWFYGPSYNESEISKLISNAHLCVSPGNVGLTAIHCMTYGLPVITHNNFEKQMPEHEIISEGVTGAFFEQNNIINLEEVIQYWLANHPKTFKQMKTCMTKVDEEYNPGFQMSVFKKVIPIH